MSSSEFCPYQLFGYGRHRHCGWADDTAAMITCHTHVAAERWTGRSSVNCGAGHRFPTTAGTRDIVATTRCHCSLVFRGFRNVLTYGTAQLHLDPDAGSRSERACASEPDGLGLGADWLTGLDDGLSAMGETE